MTTVIEDQDARELAQREEKRRRKFADAQLRRAMQDVFGTEAGRRVLWAFLQDAAVDTSPLRADPMTTAHAIGWADAGGWWLNAMRQHCPEREATMRAEARKFAREGAPDEVDDEDS